MRWNLAGNMVGRAWQGTMSLLSVPIYLGVLGTEAFGIVSLVQTLHAFFAVLDLGLSATATREISILRGPGGHSRAANLLRTCEWINWTIAILIAIVVAAAASWISRYWVAQQALAQSDIALAITLGGITLAARWPVALYSGVLRGLERQVLQNAILMASAAARVFLTTAVLLLISPTIHCFLLVQIAVNLLEALILGFAARRLVDPKTLGRFDVSELQRIWRFALSFNLVGTLGMLVSSADRLIISKLLPFSALTYYSVCATATGSLQVVYLAVAVATFPRMSCLWRDNDVAQLTRLYRRSLRLPAFFCLGPILLFCFFPAEVLHLWTRSPETANSGAAILPIMALTLLLNCAGSPAYNVLIATAHTRLPLLVNAISLPVVWGGCYFAIRCYGLLGAAVCALLSNLGCFLIYGTYCRTRILRVPSTTLGFGLGFPIELLVPAIGIGLLARMTLPPLDTPAVTIFAMICVVILFYLCGLALLTKEERSLIRSPFAQLSLRPWPLKPEAS